MVIGGVDVARIPEFNYGIWNSRWKAVFVGYGIRNADKVLAVDASIKNDAARLANYDGANIEVVPTGFDHTVWMPASKKENFVLTVAHCTEQNRGMIKGLDFLASIAGAMPDVRFILIGMSKTISKAFPFTDNVELYQYLPQNQLVEFYQRAKIYLQPSRREGLPNSLCEAMLCECFPIGTDVGGIPSAIGKTGAIIPFNDLNGAVKAITQGLVRDRCSDARTQIVNNFSIEKREASLLSIIDKLSHG